MGLFNTVLRVPATCPECTAEVSVGVQFKYGETWQYEYVLGDLLRWGSKKTNVGSPGRSRVVADGEAVPSCPVCGYDRDWPLYVFIEHDRIVSVGPADGTYDFFHADSTFLDIGETSDGAPKGGDG